MTNRTVTQPSESGFSFAPRGLARVWAAILVIAFSAGAVVGFARADAPAAASVSPLAGPRDLFAHYGLDHQFFASLDDGKPLNGDELEKALKLLYRFQRSVELADIERWAKTDDQWRQISAAPAGQRGEIFRMPGVVRRVTSEEVPESLRARFEMDRYYRCQFEAEGGGNAMVITPRVSKEWKLDEAVEYRSQLTGVLLKETVEGDGSRAEKALAFVAQRMPWYPKTELGELGMDAALLDDVRDRKSIRSEEREAFYQLLAVVGRTKPRELVRSAAQEVVRRREEMEKRLKQADPDSKQHALLTQRLERLRLGSMDVVPLFNEPDRQRGKLVTLDGLARRAVKIRVEDADIVERFGIDHYYEIEIFTNDSQQNPIAFCVREVSPSMPLGEHIHENVRIAGFFFKSWAYATRRPQSEVVEGQRKLTQQQLAPLLIAREAIWLPADQVKPPSLTGLFIAVVLGAFSLWILWSAWRWAWGDRRAEANPFSGGDARLGSLTKPDAAPDFSRLHES